MVSCSAVTILKFLLFSQKALHFCFGQSPTKYISDSRSRAAADRQVRVGKRYRRNAGWSIGGGGWKVGSRMGEVEEIYQL